MACSIKPLPCLAPLPPPNVPTRSRACLNRRRLLQPATAYLTCAPLVILTSHARNILIYLPRDVNGVAITRGITRTALSRACSFRISAPLLLRRTCWRARGTRRCAANMAPALSVNRRDALLSANHGMRVCAAYIAHVRIFSSARIFSYYHRYRVIPPYDKRHRAGAQLSTSWQRSNDGNRKIAAWRKRQQHIGNARISSVAWRLKNINQYVWRSAA